MATPASCRPFIKIRKGSNKEGYIGILQPFFDAVELFIKDQVVPTVSYSLVYYTCLVFSLFIP